MAQTARETQGSNVTVHFWLLGCAEPGISYGLTGPSQPFNGGPELPARLGRLSELINDADKQLSVDRLLISIGGNDVYWAKMLQSCLPLLPGYQDACVAGFRDVIGNALEGLPQDYQ